jgi:hypothetical protein
MRLTYRSLLLYPSLLIPGILLGQGTNVPNRQSAVEGAATREMQQPSRAGSTPGSGESARGVEDDGVNYSDTGLQRVVNKKENAFSVDAGASTSYMYRSNALSTNGAIARAAKSGVVDVSAYASMSMGSYDVWDGVFVPRVGYSFSSIMHSQRDLRFADYMTNRFSVSGDLRFENGWSISPSLDQSHIISSEFHTEDYSEWYPNLSVSKLWGIDQNTTVRATATTGYHFSKVDALGGTVPGVTEDRLDNWTNSINLSFYRNLFFGIVLQAYGDLSVRSFGNGQNKGRSDVVKTAGGSLNYNWRFLRFSTYLNLTNRDSSDDLNKYENFDLGATLGASFTF